MARPPAGHGRAARFGPTTRPRETDVLLATEAGLSVRATARTLRLTEGTVRNHLSSAIAKTGAGDRNNAVRHARRRGWLPIERPDG